MIHTIDAEHRKYFNKFGVTQASGVDWQKESNRALARCSICVRLYDGAHKSDKLILETRNGRDYLCCEAHRKREGGIPVYEK